MPRHRRRLAAPPRRRRFASRRSRPHRRGGGAQVMLLFQFLCFALIMLSAHYDRHIPRGLGSLVTRSQKTPEGFGHSVPTTVKVIINNICPTLCDALFLPPASAESPRRAVAAPPRPVYVLTAIRLRGISAPRSRRRRDPSMAPRRSASAESPPRRRRDPSTQVASSSVAKIRASSTGSCAAASSRSSSASRAASETPSRAAGESWRRCRRAGSNRGRCRRRRTGSSAPPHRCKSCKASCRAAAAGPSEAGG